MKKINSTITLIISISFLFIFGQVSVISSLEPKEIPRPGPST